jgi:membrane-associated phospholipid phosphatase
LHPINGAWAAPLIGWLMPTLSRAGNSGVVWLALFGLIAVFGKRAGWTVAPAGLLVLAAAISYPRVYVGVHYPTDVVPAGTGLGIACGWIGARRVASLGSRRGVAVRIEPAASTREARKYNTH